MHQHSLTIGPLTRGLTDITRPIATIAEGAGVTTGLCHVFIHHTSASLVVQENADADVQRDLEAFLSRLVPDGDPLFRHVEEGPDDMSAHVKAALTSTSLTIPITGGRLGLGRWQGLYLWEHRDAAGLRKLTVTIQG